MGFFTKTKEAKEERLSLPDLPRLPEIDTFEENEERRIHKLPSLPHNSLGTKFSQDTIKGAVSGEREDDFADADEPEFEEDDMRMMQEPLRQPMTSEIDEDMPPIRRGFANARDSTEPIFVRIDLFEDALKVFSEAKKKVVDIERDLSDIKRVREKEDAELREWENEVKSMKNQIEKVEREVFSKI